MTYEYNDVSQNVLRHHATRFITENIQDKRQDVGCTYMYDVPTSAGHSSPIEYAVHAVDIPTLTP